MDSMLAIHKEAIDSNVDKYHQFLSDFKRTQKMLYGFVEGGDDKAYYYALFKRTIPSDWDVMLYDAGCKKNVLDIYKCFNWNEYNRDRILFFVDRDLDDVFSKNPPSTQNIYITDGYSIENSIATKKVFKSLFECNCKIPTAKHSEYDYIAEKFEKELDRFIKETHSIMNWIVYNRFRNTNSEYKKIEMKDIFFFENGRLSTKKHPKNHKNLFDYIRKICKGKYNYRDKEGILFLNKYNHSQKNIRGKYLSWFIVNFFNHIIKYASSYFQGVNSPIKKRSEINTQNIIELAVIYVDTPTSFSVFMKESCTRFISNYTNQQSPSLN